MSVLALKRLVPFSLWLFDGTDGASKTASIVPSQHSEFVSKKSSLILRERFHSSGIEDRDIDWS